MGKQAGVPWPPRLQDLPWTTAFREWMEELREELEDWGADDGEALWKELYYLTWDLPEVRQDKKSILRALPTVFRRVRLDAEDQASVKALFNAWLRTLR